MMAPARKILSASKISAKKARASARDPMVELEEGLFRLTTQCNAMDLDEAAPLFVPMDIDWTGIMEALAFFIPPPVQLIRFMVDFGPPPPLMRSVADIGPPPALIRSVADDGLYSATGIV
jgi:hypothetical protein